jgi:ubiquinone/menaquinone biosynthesis C-methylase UbiE
MEYAAQVVDPSDEQARIYQERADEYDVLISAEDAAGALVRELERRAPFDGRHVVDVGAGTGRIARLVASAASGIVLVERAAPMLEVARRRLDAMGVVYAAHLADARAMPLSNASADLAIAGWVFGHFRLWMPDGWRDEVEAAIGEMRRVVRAGGKLVIVETLGTGHVEPRRNAALDEYFALLEERWGFTRSWIRTDYSFSSVDEAARVCGSFFGEALAERIRQNAWATVPECTAVFVAER